MADPRSASLLTQAAAAPPQAAFGFGPSTKRPANPPLGFLYYDTTLSLEIVWTGTWRVIGVQPVAMVGFGSTAQRPTNPQPGFIYFDNTVQQSLTWNGSAWVGVVTPVQMVGFGSTANRPSSPPSGFLYFDTTLQHELTWNGVAWVDIGPGAGSPPPPGSPPVITSSSSAAATIGVPFTFNITASGTPSSYGVSGTLPSGLSLNASTGVISGTPTQIVAAPLTVSATNGYGTGTGALTVTVSSASVTPGRFLRVVGVAIVLPNSNPAIVGATIDSSSSTTLAVQVTVNGPFPPGTNITMVDPNGLPIYSSVTTGGESNVSFSVTTTAAGGYSVVVSSSSAEFVATIDVSISAGSGRFSNGSVRGVTTGPVLSPPNGLAIALFLRDIDPTTTMSFASFNVGTDNTLRQAPGYSWNLAGDTTNNPKTNFTAGATQLDFVGYSSVTLLEDSRIDANG